ncbi:Polysaccharide deacetylase family protein [Desulfonema limicola]|uniref:Polysaccharide deacetylase family protein n=1 Tax=Desulfonema limicola TaxID=45656 RepID=A0A975B5D1_9BACT|nr:polysaccharide deacetylase family protein [Desulfonema limicola]QTA79101.1 Polysaccharide deacetylase family protein [Desulfonema limicola]
MKYSISIKNIMFKTGIMSLLQNAPLQNAAILRYHAVTDAENNYYSSPSIAVSPHDFEIQVKYFAQNCNVISLDTLAECILSKKKFPKKSIVMTFDDGYQDNYSAYQIMKKYKIQGTFYVAAGCLGQGETLWLFEVIFLIQQTKKLVLYLDINNENLQFPLSSKSEKMYAMRKITEIIKSNNLETRENIRKQLRIKLNDVNDLNDKAKQVMLSWKQVKEMSDNGMTIGGHTMTHINLPNADYEDAKREIYECKSLIEEKTGKPVKHFSYPNGGNYDYYNDTIMQIIKQAGYLTSTTSNNGLVNMNSRLLELSRIRITNNLSEIVYQTACEPFVKKMLRRD